VAENEQALASFAGNYDSIGGLCNNFADTSDHGLYRSDNDYYRRIYMRILPSVFFTLKTGSLSIGIRESFFVG